MAKSELSLAHFHDEAAAIAYLEGKLWPQGPICPKCGGEGYALNGVKDKKGRERLGLKKCRACRAQFTLRIGTIFEDSHAPLHLWLQAIALLAASKKGISSNQLHRTLGVTLKTAWHMSHRIRLAMAPSGAKLPPIGGAGKVVEVDETYQGRVKNPAKLRTDGTPFKNKRAGRGGVNKRAVIALIERGGSARTFHVAEANAATIHKIMRDHIDRRSTVHTDGATMYRGIGREFESHDYVDHSMGEYARYEENGAVVHNNSCESYFSVLKKGLGGVYQHCSEKHLHRYLAEFEFRYNNRVALGVNDAARMDRTISQVVGKRLTYKAADRTAE